MRALYLRPTGEVASVEDPRLATTSERHKLPLTVPSGTAGDPVQLLARDSRAAGLIIEMYVGWVGRDRLAMIRAVLARGRRVWLYWPDETAIECVDRERLRSHWRHWLFITTIHAMQPVMRFWRHSLSTLRSVPKRELPRIVIRKLLREIERPIDNAPKVDAAAPAARPRTEALDALIAGARSVPFAQPAHEPDDQHRIPGY